ncbi:DUF58 domain-containing protein [Viridibacillus sp. YIM B01967]|uniref:DUF58 domain-containing protein n=1 Tax=Viridibacillus soli TaxID=2798301 RepID=A0ABS1H9Y1_9BACL|nr:DUF58 domain-containing protein [Viridibacillus soli]MBK3496219.1 DUF58 domain-containing protein [Viridibacillus soli]
MTRSRLRYVSGKIIRLMLLVLLLLSTLAFGIIEGGFVSWFIFFMILPFASYSLLLFFTPLKTMEVERSLEAGRMRNGDSLKMTMTLKRKMSWPIAYAVIHEAMPSEVLANATTEPMQRLLLIGFKKQVKWTYEIEEIPRGEHQLQGIEMTVSDFFGWIQKTELIPAKRTVVVYPNVTKMIFRPLEMSMQTGNSPVSSAIVRDTTMVTGLREYQAGDRMSWIHWKTFAKTGELRTKEFEDQQSQDLCLVLDCSPSSLFEDEVELVASILNAVVRQQITLSFLSAGRERVYFDSIQTESQLQQAMFHLAGVQDELLDSVGPLYGQDRTLANAAQILFVTSELTADWLDILTTSRGCVCFVVRNKGQVMSMQEQAMEKLAHVRGIRVITIAKEQFADAFMGVLK